MTFDAVIGRSSVDDRIQPMVSQELVEMIGDELLVLEKVWFEPPTSAKTMRLDEGEYDVCPHHQVQRYVQSPSYRAL